MPANDFVQQLALLGLEELPAKAYVKLLQNGPLKASDIAKSLDISRPEAYRVLEELSTRGFSMSGATRPAVYHAQEPDRVLATLKAGFTNRIENIEHLRREMTNMMSNMKRTALPVREFQYRMIVGSDEIANAVEQLEVSASRDLRVVSNNINAVRQAKARGLLGLSPWRTLKENVNVQVLLRADTKDVLELVGDGRRTEVRLATSDIPFRFMVADSREALVVIMNGTDITPGAKTEELAMHTDSKTVVKMCDFVYEHLWSTATPLAAQRLSN